MINQELLKKYIDAMGIEIDDYVLDRFDVYAERLVSWNKKVNLTAITDPDEIVVKHFVDCLMILRYLDIDGPVKVIDVGCGAGFPGMPLLLARPQIGITFLDSVAKKLHFIKDVLRSCGLFQEVNHNRAEDLGREHNYREQYDIATARAVAPLNILAEYCMPFVKVGGYFVALKGPEENIDEGKNAIDKLGGEIINDVSYKLPNGDKRRMIIVKKISQTPTKYPRRSKRITSKPL